jgi:hypothetical protein
MFGLHSKKQPKAPSNPWLVQILTPEYLIDGYCQPEEDLFLSLSTSSYTDILGITLTSAYIQPTGNLSISPFSSPKWILSFSSMCLAVIPRDESSLKAAREAFNEYQYPFHVVLYAGPFIIRGTMLSNDEDDPTPFYENFTFFPMIEADIDCLIPGSKLSRLNAPFLALNSIYLHGLELLP